MASVGGRRHGVAVDARDTLHHLVDRLPDGELNAARRFLEFLVADRTDGDPLLRALDAAPDADEELSAEEEARMSAAYGRFARGEGRYLTNDEMARRLGD